MFKPLSFFIDRLKNAGMLAHVPRSPRSIASCDCYQQATADSSLTSKGRGESIPESDEDSKMVLCGGYFRVGGKFDD